MLSFFSLFFFGTIRTDEIFWWFDCGSPQMDPPLQCDYRPRRTTKTRRVSTIPERGMAILHWGDQHERGICALLRDVAGRCG